MTHLPGFPLHGKPAEAKLMVEDKARSEVDKLTTKS
jgi:hypothetical protein